MSKILVVKDNKVDIGAYDQEPTHYTHEALYKQHNVVNGYYHPELKMPYMKRFNEVKVGDSLYSLNVGKVIEYIVTDISEREVEVTNKYRYGFDSNEVICKATLVTITYKSLKAGRKGTIELFKETARDTTDGFDIYDWGRPEVGKGRQLFPNTVECATEKRIFSSKDACMWYLQVLYEERMFKVRNMIEDIKNEIKYANEYTPTLEEWGWEKPKENFNLEDYE